MGNNMNFGVTGVTGDWGDRRPDLFIDAMVKSAAVLNRFSIVDGVKSKLNVPIFSVTAQAGDGDGFVAGANCSFDETFDAAITEKEMTVQTFHWGFKNCKDALEASYRGLMLKKGQLNPETLDAEFRAWIFDRFAKLAAQKALLQANTELLAEMKSGGDAIPAGQVVDIGATAISSSNILDHMEDAYEAMSEVMVAAVYGDADREFKPAYFLGSVAYQAYQIAIAGKHTTTPEGIIKGEIPTYYGMEVVHMPSLTANNFFVSAPSNLVLLTDNYNDTGAIGNEYEAKEQAEYLFGRFKLGFDYYKGSEMVIAYDAA
tara:strand:- start:144 stop:1091 length:948 start_codon:yes stop_codon:yes gene_type:complete